MIAGASIVDWAKLGQAVGVSVVVGLGVVTVAALGVATWLRAQDEHAAGSASTVLLRTATALCVAVLASTVILGVYLLSR